MKSLLAVLNITNFRNLWFAQVLTQITLNMLTFALVVLVYERTSSNTAVSLLYLAVALPGTLFGTLSGVLVDRLNKKKTLLFTTLARIALLLPFFFTHQLWVYYILITIISLVSQFFIPAEAALIPLFVPKHLLLSANSLFTLTFYSAIIGGFVAGGPLLAAIGTDQLFLVIVGLFVLAALFLFLLPARDPVMAQDKKVIATSVKSDLISGLTFISKTTQVAEAILLMTLSQAIIAIFATLGPGFADQILSIALTDSSVIILGPAALGMVIGALMIGVVGARFSRKAIVRSGILASGSLFLLVASIVQLRSWTEGRIPTPYGQVAIGAIILPIAMVSFFLLGVANALIDVTCNTILQERTSDEMRGKVYGFLSSLISGVAILPVVVSGLIADLFGINKIIFVIGFFLVVLAITAPRLRRKGL